jgi:hypothetical protein
MILQLKITLKDSKPLIWRRVEVRSSNTFAELHRVIQESFEWHNSHLHGFQIRKTNSVQLDDYVSIGPMDSTDFGFFDSDFNDNYDEDQVLLKDVFIKEKDRVWYTYDFGDNWEHDVVLEKFLPEKKGIFYPRCTKAMRAAPEEDSRFEHLDGIVTEDVDPKTLQQDINDSFLKIFENEEAQESKGHLGHREEE